FQGSVATRQLQLIRVVAVPRVEHLTVRRVILEGGALVDGGVDWCTIGKTMRRTMYGESRSAGASTQVSAPSSWVASGCARMQRSATSDSSASRARPACQVSA